MLGTSVATLDNQLRTLIASCTECASACVTCIETCIASGMTDTFRACAQACSDCADICQATATVASRYSGGDAGALAALARACIKACGEAGEECAAHSNTAAAQCIQAARACSLAAMRVSNTLRWR